MASTFKHINALFYLALTMGKNLWFAVLISGWMALCCFTSVVYCFRQPLVSLTQGLAIKQHIFETKSHFDADTQFYDLEVSDGFAAVIGGEV